MRAAQIGKILSEETKAKISVTKTGQKYSEETRAKMSAAKIGLQKKRKKSYVWEKRGKTS